MPEELNQGQASQEPALNTAGLNSEPTSLQDSGDSQNAGQESGFTYKGRKMTSAQEVQSVLEHAEKVERLAGKHANEVGALREQLARLSGMVEAQIKVKEDPDKPYKELSDKFFENPELAFKTFDDQLTEKFNKMLQKEKSELVKQQQVTKAAAEIWDDFYERHPHLSGYRKNLIPAIQHELGPTINHLSTEEALERIAEVATKRHLEIVRQAQGSANKGTVVEPAGGSKVKMEIGLPKDPQTVSELQKSYVDSHKALKSRLRPSQPNIVK